MNPQRGAVAVSRCHEPKGILDNSLGWDDGFGKRSRRSLWNDTVDYKPGNDRTMPPDKEASSEAIGAVHIVSLHKGGEVF